jgi:hypothetical protein
MLLKVFRENQAFTVLFLFMLSIILWSLVVFNKSFDPGIQVIYNYSGFYLLPALHSINNHASLSAALNVLLVLFSGFYLTRIITRYQLIPGRNLMPLLVFFFLCLPWFASFTGFSYTLLTLPVLLYVTDKLYQSADSKNISYSYFNSAMILSVATLLNHFLILYLLFVFFLFIRLRGSRWRELVFIILGTVLPYAILFSLLYLFNANISGFIKSIGLLWQFKLDIEFNQFFIGFGMYLTLLFLIASWYLVNHYVKMKIITRKYSITLFVLFLLSALFMLFVPSVSRDSLIFIAAPLAYLFGYYFNTCKINIINQILFFLFLSGSSGLFVFSFF